MVAMHRAISPATARSSAETDSSAPGVSITVTSGSPSSSARFIARRASRSAAGPMARPAPCRVRSWPTSTHGWPSSRVRATTTVSSRSPSSVPRRRRVSVAAYRSRSRTPARPGSRVISTDSHAVRAVSAIGSRRGRDGALGRVQQDPQRAVDQLGQLLGGDDGVDDALGGEVLRLLHPGRERLAVERLEDLGPEEADQRAGLGDRDVAERAPRRVDAAGGGVPQVHEVGQPGGPVGPDRPGDLDHLDEGRRPLLHAGAARRRGRQEGQALGGRAAYGGGDAARRVPPDRAGEEAELVGHHRHRPAADQAAAGDDGLVRAGLLARRRAARAGSPRRGPRCRSAGPTTATSPRRGRGRAGPRRPSAGAAR